MVWQLDVKKNSGVTKVGVTLFFSQKLTTKK